MLWGHGSSDADLHNTTLLCRIFLPDVKVTTIYVHGMLDQATYHRASAIASGVCAAHKQSLAYAPGPKTEVEWDVFVAGVRRVRRRLAD